MVLQYKSLMFTLVIIFQKYEFTISRCNDLLVMVAEKDTATVAQAVLGLPMAMLRPCSRLPPTKY